MTIAVNWQPDVEKPDAKKSPEPIDGQADRWPIINDAAYHGLIGDAVAALRPYTEADSVAVLFTLLAVTGCYLGTGPHLRGGNTAHPGRIWPILTGDSSSGAKGTTVSVTWQLLRAVDPMFAAINRASGLSTSEGLIRRVRDANGDDPDAPGFDEGVADKRLLVVEPEFVNVLTRSRRDGNSLSGTIRDAYDGVPLQTLVSHTPLLATDPHITIVAAITPQELVSKLTDTDIVNGFANRFMVVCCKRSKLLPDGGDPPAQLLAELGYKFRQAAKTAADTGQMQRSEQAAALWSAEYHRRFGADALDGPMGMLTARWHAHSTRMSVVYAALDGSRTVDEQHLKASLAAWDYVEKSIRYVFEGERSDRDLGRLAEFVDNADENGRTRDEISKELFQRHKSREELDRLLVKLIGLGRYRVARVPTGGRPREVYRRA